MTHKDEWYIIRNAPSGFVLDGSDPSQIRIQYFTGYDQQLWKFENGSQPGLFYIVNKNTGSAIEAVGGVAALRPKNDSLRQQWHLNSNGRIVNAQFRQNLDVTNENYNPGTTIKLWKDNGCSAQEYVLQKKV